MGVENSVFSNREDQSCIVPYEIDKSDTIYIDVKRISAMIRT